MATGKLCLYRSVYSLSASRQKTAKKDFVSTRVLSDTNLIKLRSYLLQLMGTKSDLVLLKSVSFALSAFFVSD